MLDGARRVLVLEDVVDHTNVGAVFRSAAALGVDAVLVTPRCADPLYRRSIRVSMGTVFQVPWTRIDPWPEGVDAAARARASPSAALALADDSVGLDELAADPPERLALVLGTEGDGLSPAHPRGGRPHRADPDGRRRRLAQRAAAGAVAAWALRGARTDGVRIVVSGTHASGKSTLVSDLALALRGTPSCPTPSSWSTTASSRPGPRSFVRAARRRGGAARRAARRRPTWWPSAARSTSLAYLEALPDLGRRSAGPRP